jgi:hypothetical protein
MGPTWASTVTTTSKDKQCQRMDGIVMQG